MNKEFYKIDCNEFRNKLSLYLKKGKGDIIYITRYNKLVAEFRVYTDKIKAETELKIAEGMLEALEKKLSRVP